MQWQGFLWTARHVPGGRAGGMEHQHLIEGHARHWAGVLDMAATQGAKMSKKWTMAGLFAEPNGREWICRGNCEV